MNPNDAGPNVIALAFLAALIIWPIQTVKAMLIARARENGA